MSSNFSLNDVDTIYYIITFLIKQNYIQISALGATVKQLFNTSVGTEVKLNLKYHSLYSYSYSHYSNIYQSNTIFYLEFHLNLSYIITKAID